MSFATWHRHAWHRLPPPLRRTLVWVWASVQRWINAAGPQLGASIAFYTIFSLAPLLVIAIAIAGAVFGQEAARGQVVAQIQDLVGLQAAQAIQAMIEAAWRQPGGGLAAVMGLATLLVGATGVFAELQRALNAIGHIKPKRTGVSAMLRVRLTAFALLLGFGFLLIASLLVSAVLAGVLQAISARYPALAVLARVSELGVSFLVLSVAFGSILRWLPDEAPSRRALIISACVSAGLFVVGKTFIGMYLGRASVASSYGAAGSFVVVLLWVYYSSQILLFGAALGREWDARQHRVTAAQAAAHARAGAGPAPGVPGGAAGGTAPHRLHGQPGGGPQRVSSAQGQRARRH
ncbi:YihY/virulence factor BrkB family protein [uncultured Azohydromonas sp.]|jgi:Predicted membrane protein|uniref:YihY/virulence factor BrkB family protein n=1 Tax=uncultured Azohydromonas sp. TaxID=487342 RepID=UPI00260FEEB0|nr:YihY/virulence factor BrkB family protein [uncultured Azohydromonas sp.]